ncbi:unnamed protein product, partial [marine sediment metagenome]
EIWGLFNKITIPYSRIAEVRHSRWSSPSLIRVVFKERTLFGKSIHYVTSFVWDAWDACVGRVPKDVIFLREKIAAAAKDERAS